MVLKQFARNELYEPIAKQGSRWKGEWLSKCVKDYWIHWEIGSPEENVAYLYVGQKRTDIPKKWVPIRYSMIEWTGLIFLLFCLAFVAFMSIRIRKIPK